MRRYGNRMGNRGGPSNRGFSNDRNFGNGSIGPSAGPLRTDHLQLHASHHQLEGIRNTHPRGAPALLDLDLELELLKCKREIIEKQQNMLLNDSRFASQSNQYNVVKPSQGYGSQFSENRNFSNFNNDVAGPQFDHFDRQQSLKRSAADGWNNGPAAKHYGGPSRSGQAPRRLDHVPRQNSRFDQNMGSGPVPQSRAPDHRRPANFKQNKVTKPKRNPASVPNKLANYPINERKNLIAQTAPLTRTPHSNPKKSVEILIFKDNETPGPKLLGRLELALGNVLREVRDQFGELEEYSEIFRSQPIQRAIKQVIRKRIRKAMLNKQVGACSEIVNAYREQFPKDTDLDLITKARDTCKNRRNLAIQLIESGNPEKYFKLNFYRLLNVTLTKMFDQLSKLYDSEPLKNKETVEMIESIIIDLESDPAYTRSLAKTEVDGLKTEGDDGNKTAETVNEETAQKDNKTIQKDEESAQLDEISANAEKTVENVVKAEKNTENTTENAENVTENVANISESAKEETSETDNQDTIDPMIDTIMDQCLKAKKNISEPLKVKFFNKLIEELIRKILPLTLPKYKEYMINIINSDEEFKKTKAYLIAGANKKAERIAAQHHFVCDPEAVVGTQPPYYAKIIGRPSLPNKALMKTFLDKFHPKYVKKHKGINNVLYVTFSNKEDYQNLLDTTGAVIGSSKLDIRVSVKISKLKIGPNAHKNSAPANGGNVQMTELLDDVKGLDESLDNQITDLLTSIREEEEKKEEEQSQEVNNEDVEINEEDPKEVQEIKNDNIENATEKGEVKQDNEGKENEDDKTENGDKETAPKEEEKKDVVQKDVEATKNDDNQSGRATPTRSSSRLATSTPSAIRTRRASKLAQN